MRLALRPYMLCPTNIFTSSPSSTPCDYRQRTKILFWNYLSITSTEMIQSCKYIQLLANNFQSHQPIPSNHGTLFWNYFNLTSFEKARSCKYIQILADPFSVSLKPFIWVSLRFWNFFILLKASPPSTTALEESSVKIHFFGDSFPHHTLKLCTWTSLEGAFVERENSRQGKFPTYHKLTQHTTKSPKYNQLQSATYCY